MKLLNDPKSSRKRKQAPPLSYTSTSVNKQQFTEVDRKRLVDRYTDWLHKNAEYARTHAEEIQQARRDYRHTAMKRQEDGGKSIRIFAPFRADASAFKTVTIPQIVVVLILILLFVAGIFLSYTTTLTIVMTVITVYYLGDVILNVMLCTRSMDHTYEECIDEETIARLKDVEWPTYTILCPLYKEAPVVAQFVQAIKNIDYPVENLQILLLTEANDPETREALFSLDLPAHFSIVNVPPGTPQTKPRACNYGLVQATGEYIVIYDAEDIMDPLQLKRAVLAFANHGPEIVCVQAKLNFYNLTQNLLTRWFTAEYSAWYDLILTGLQRLRLPLPLGGTSNHFRSEVLRALGGWDAFNVTEDCDLGLRLSRYQLDTIVLDSTTYEEANSQFKSWIRQRSRWIKGYTQTYLVHMRHPLRMLRKGQYRQFISLQLLIAGKVISLFLNPFLWLMVAAFFIFRPWVETFYHQVFPAPVLYMGTLCLIFGNFFFIYTHLFGCLKRQQYSLVKYAVFIPIYWLMMSIAGTVALFQLITKPHYWEKTRHGLHLKGQAAINPVPGNQTVTTTNQFYDQPTDSMMGIIPPSTSDNSPLQTVTSAVQAVRAAGKPAFDSAFTHEEKQVLARRKVAIKDLWLSVTILVACCASIIATAYYYYNNMTLLYSDAYSHLRIARSVFDSLTPGFAQLGGDWLPLHHIFMFPFIWNDFLWQTGLAGTIPSMIAYVVASIYLYLILRNITHHGSASFIGTLAFMLNPNILYLQSTPLSELESVAFLLITIYYFLCWVQKEHPKYLVLAALGTFASSLIRYDGWALFLALSVAIIIIGLWRKQGRQKIEANLLIYGTLGILGILLWMWWCQAIFGDFLYFQHGQYSAQAQQIHYLKVGALYAYHNLWQSFRLYGLDATETFGTGLSIAAILAIVVFYLRYRFTPITLVATILLIPFAFYIVTQYFGQSIIVVPGSGPTNAPGQWFNVRYGVQMVAPFSFFIAAAIANIRKVKRENQAQRKGSGINLYPIASIVLQISLFAAIIAQMLFTTNVQGILSLDDGLYNLTCSQPIRPIQVYLDQHYNGGLILTNEYTSQLNAQDFGANFKDIIYEGSGPYWRQALADPASIAQWVVIRPGNQEDVVANQLFKHKAAFLSRYSFVLQESDGLQIYRRNDVTNLPDRPISARLIALQQLCSKY